ncbi:hypothetical protein FAM23868_001960 [Propionibacterium freudenreichii]|uniref:DUF7448 domain-containing protein n=1 Tax=Propionibacterium freudenreichii TaxID=1744 RepID=UPI00254E2449|nr:hypothetical protein [Propionibacterium freudenreichii]MDK9332620.1 hypothetical protein [Propionibacterium freudenreichii]
MSEREIYDLQPDDLAGVLVGHRIAGLDPHAKTLTLDDGTVLELLNSEYCCAWYRVSAMEAFDLGDNIITGVQQVVIDLDEHAEADEAWRLTAISGDKKIASIAIEGDPSSGYYCHSIDLAVRPKDGAA